MENLKCLPCPPSQLPLILALASLALIIFAVASSSFDFPPLVSTAQSMKVFLSGMQAYVSIRLIDIAWPPVVLGMFDFTRFFTFTFDVIRPECTIDYSPQTKLIFVLIGPFAAALFIISLIFAYTVFKCLLIAWDLEDYRFRTLLDWSFPKKFRSVFMCMLTSSLSRKFSNLRMMTDGALWNALNPWLSERSNLTVLSQKTRRRTVLQQHLYNSDGFKKTMASGLPQEWLEMKSCVLELDLETSFARSAKRFRLLLASALSIFVFTFQGSIEAALSTFDCKEVNGVPYLRSNPNVQCDFSNAMYPNMIAITAVGVGIYCVFLPLIALLTLRSRWCREMYMHDNMAYNHIFGFLTSLYTKACSYWELAACAKKLVFVAIPVLISKDPLVQSVAMFLWLIIYMFVIVKKHPMVGFLNDIETLSCVGVIVGSFASIFFTVEYGGEKVLQGSARDFAGLVLVLICLFCTIWSLRLMRLEFARNLL